MNYLEVQTGYGPVCFVGRLYAAIRPTLLVIGGAFPPKEFRHSCVDEFPGANVIVANIPGMKCPSHPIPTANNFSRAFDELISTLLPPPRPVVVHGVSTGCLISLGLRSPNIVHQIAEEPFFDTEDLWPLIDEFRDRLVKEPENVNLRAFLWNLFGYSTDRIVNRSYHELLDGLEPPVDVIVGREPLLPRREVDTWPSLTSAADRDFLTSNANATIHEGTPGSGHGLILDRPNAALLKQLTLDALHRAAKSIG
jgi:pimeloyl-ACP methyl ester carboxylesterase